MVNTTLSTAPELEILPTVTLIDILTPPTWPFSPPTWTTSQYRTPPHWTTIQGLGPPVPNPFKHNLPLSMGFSFPSYIALIIFSALAFYIIFKRFRSLLNIYLSVLFYIMSQLLLLMVLSVSWITELLDPEETESRCQIKQGLQTFALLLPGYSILIITGVRSIFVTFPLSYFYYIKKRYQLATFGGFILICGLIAAAPSFGLCKAVVQSTLVNGQSEEMEYCSYDDRNKSECKVFYSVVLVVGLLLPNTSVIALYIYICRLAAKAKDTHRSLTSSSTTPIKETKAMTEQRTIPWSIIAILVVCLTTTLPWAGMIVYTVEITKMLAEGEKLSYVFDVFYSVLQILIGCSPLVYLLTTNSMRRELVKMLKSAKDCCGQ